MSQFPASGIEINGEFVINVDRNAGTCGHKNGIEALGLAFQEPF